MMSACHDNHEGACCEMIFPFQFQSTHGACQDGAHCETIVLAWPQMMCGVHHDDHDGAHYNMSALGWLRMTHGVRHGGDAAKGWCCALNILLNDDTELAFISFPSLSMVAELCHVCRSHCLPYAMVDCSSRSCSTTTSLLLSGGGIRCSEGQLDLHPPMVITMGCWGGSSSMDDAEDRSATGKADACIEATSWQCLLLSALCLSCAQPTIQT